MADQLRSGGWQFDGLAFRSSSTTPPPLKPYVENCGYTGRGALIICDVLIFERLLHRWGMDVRINDNGPPTLVAPCTFADACEFVVSWILAHEMGHVLANHPPSHFAHSSLASYVKGATIAEKRELEADSYAVSVFGDPKLTDERFDFYRSLTAAFNTEAVLALCPDYSPLLQRPCDKEAVGVGLVVPRNFETNPIAFSTGGSHPEFVVRTIRILRLAEERYGYEFFGSALASTYARMRARPASSVRDEQRDVPTQ